MLILMLIGYITVYSFKTFILQLLLYVQPVY